MPEILVHIVEGRSVESKKALMRDITDAVVRNFQLPAERVVVQIVESRKSDKSRGGVPFDEM
jgi:4-oxalocrotonate tautomerase